MTGDSSALDELAAVQAALSSRPRWAPGVAELERQALELRRPAQREAARRFGIERIVATRRRDGSFSIEASTGACLAELPALVSQVRVTRLNLALDEEEAPDPHWEEFLRLDALRGIEALCLQEVELRPDSATRLLQAPVWEGLRILELGIDACEPEHLAAFATARAPRSLAELRCTGFDSGMGDPGLVALASAPWLDQLERLDLVGQQLTDTGVRAFAATSGSLSRLRHLGLASAGYADNRIGPEGLLALADLPWFPRLRFLGLSRLAVGAVLPRVLDRAGSLRALAAGGVGLEARHLEAAVATTGWESLESLTLNSNPLGDAGAQCLGRAPRLPAVLSLQACDIGAAGLHALAGAPAIAALDLRFNPIPAAAWLEAAATGRLPRSRALGADARNWPGHLVDRITEYYPRVDLVGEPVPRSPHLPEGECWPTARLQWWFMDGSYPRLQWCRVRILRDGSWEIVDGDRATHRFLDAESARTWLREEEYVPFDADCPAGFAAAGEREDELQPPRPEDYQSDGAPAATCRSCAARWGEGEYSPDCRECGGGAMVRECPECGGICGACWRRAVQDSHDSREAHWIGRCARR